MKQMCNKKF